MGVTRWRSSCFQVMSIGERVVGILDWLVREDVRGVGSEEVGHGGRGEGGRRVECEREGESYESEGGSFVELCEWVARTGRCHGMCSYGIE